MACKCGLNYEDRLTTGDLDAHPGWKDDRVFCLMLIANRRWLDPPDKAYPMTDPELAAVIIDHMPTADNQPDEALPGEALPGEALPGKALPGDGQRTIIDDMLSAPALLLANEQDANLTTLADRQAELFHQPVAEPADLQPTVNLAVDARLQATVDKLGQDVAAGFVTLGATISKLKQGVDADAVMMRTTVETSAEELSAQVEVAEARLAEKIKYVLIAYLGPGAEMFFSAPGSPWADGQTQEGGQKIEEETLPANTQSTYTPTLAEQATAAASARALAKINPPADKPKTTRKRTRVKAGAKARAGK